MIALGDQGDRAGAETGRHPKKQQKGNLMSEHYVNKAILLDEAELVARFAFEPEDFDEFVDMAEYGVRGELGDSEYPRLEVLGVCSERFDRADIQNQDYRTEWVETGKGWNKTLSCLFRKLGGINEDLSARFLRSEDTGVLVSSIIEDLKRDVEQQDFFNARRRISSLENLKDAGLPCFRSAGDLTLGGDDDAHDCRGRNRGPGKRVIVEIAYVWG